MQMHLVFSLTSAQHRYQQPFKLPTKCPPKTNKQDLLNNIMFTVISTDPGTPSQQKKVAASTTRKVAKFKGHLHKFSPTAKETAELLRFTVVPHSRALF